jgi:tRNA threonylcarbamoyladenosine biosynthesis protein TsaB
MNILHIDTRDNKKNSVKLVTSYGEFLETTEVQARAEGILVLIQKVTEKAGISLSEISKIYCEKGPGSYTGLRVGFAIANSLSLALLIPLNDNELGFIDMPVYE